MKIFFQGLELSLGLGVRAWGQGLGWDQGLGLGNKSGMMEEAASFVFI